MKAITIVLVFATSAIAAVAKEALQPTQSSVHRLEGADATDDGAWKWCKAPVTCYGDEDCKGKDCGDWGYHCGTTFYPHTCWTYDIDALV